MSGLRASVPVRREFSRRSLVIISLAVFVIGALAAAARGASAGPLFTQPLAPFGAGSGPSSVAIGDLNGDGKPDLVVADYGGDSVSVLLGSGTGAFGTKAEFAVGFYPYSVAIGDLNGDGRPDLAVVNLASNTVSVLLGKGDGSVGAKTDYVMGGTPYSVAIGDLSGDGKLDLAVANYSTSTVSVLLGRGDGTFGAKTDFATGGFPVSVAIGDLSGDGQPDLAVANWGDNTVSVLIGNGNGTFQAKTDFPTGRYPHSVAIGDLNGDGQFDLAVANWISGTVSVLLGRGAGDFGLRTDFAAASGAATVRIGDLDGDGKLDLAVADAGAYPLYGNLVSVLLGIGDGTFGLKTDYEAGSSPLSLAIGDLNGDAKLDLAVANYGSDSVSVLINVGNGAGLNTRAGAPPPAAEIGGVFVRAWPNPMVDAARISYSVPARAEVSVCVYDIAGRQVSTLARGAMPAGAHEVRWNLAGAGGARVDAGVYLVELRAGAERAVTRVTVLQ